MGLRLGMSCRLTWALQNEGGAVQAGRVFAQRDFDQDGFDLADDSAGPAGWRDRLDGAGVRRLAGPSAGHQAAGPAGPIPGQTLGVGVGSCVTANDSLLTDTLGMGRSPYRVWFKGDRLESSRFEPVPVFQRGLYPRSRRWRAPVLAGRFLGRVAGPLFRADRPQAPDRVRGDGVGVA